jgi:hypothetical protein
MIPFSVNGRYGLPDLHQQLRTWRTATVRFGPVSSIGQRNTYLDRRMWSDDDEARISQDEGFGG